MDTHETKYVTVDGADLAYQVVGDGAQDFVYCYALGGQVDFFWQSAIGRVFEDRLTAAGCRVISFDRRGSGASDPLPASSMPTWEVMAEDLTAVCDAVGVEQAAVMGNIDSGALAILFAAMHPERVSHLILANTTARYLAAEDYPIGATSAEVDSVVELLAANWGREDFVRLIMPAYADRPEVVEEQARMNRASATPRSAAAQYDYFMRNIDVRSFLPLVQAPTLVFHATESPLLPIAHGRYLAEHLPAGPLIEWPGGDMLQPDSDQMCSDIIEFMTGQRPVDVDRVLTTVLFTDIVGSTERATAIGDRKWHVLLDAHDRAVREQLHRFKGREIHTTGDGFFVSFDGPARAIRCAQAINGATAHLGVDVRIGLHTGECEVRGDDLGGLAVHIASRIGSLAGSKEIFVSNTMKDLVIGSGIEFADRGEHELKGVPGSWKVFAVQP